MEYVAMWVRRLLILGLCGMVPSAAAAGLFSKPKLYPVGNFPIAVAIADFNHDGKADLAVSNATDNTISVLLGNGDGTFKAAVAYPAGQGTSLGGIATGDFNGDGNIDIVAAVSLTGPSGGSIAFLAGKGDGTFSPAVFIASGISPLAIAVADLNHDGHQDLFVGGNGSSAVLLGNGNGTFQTPELVDLSIFGATFGVAIADVNKDGHLDLIGTDDSGNDVAVLLGNGDGTFQSRMVFPVSNSPISVATGDFNRDGKVDIVAVNNGSNTVSVLLGNGDGTFQTAQDYFAGYYEVTGVVADVNGDGKLDIIVGAIPTPNSQWSAIAVLAGRGDGTFAPAIFCNAGLDEWGVAVGRLNADRKPDVVVTAPFTSSVDVLLNTAIH
jgi:hypothetical protein